MITGDSKRDKTDAHSAFACIAHGDTCHTAARVPLADLLAAPGDCALHICNAHFATLPYPNHLPASAANRTGRHQSTIRRIPWLSSPHHPRLEATAVCLMRTKHQRGSSPWEIRRVLVRAPAPSPRPSNASSRRPITVGDVVGYLGSRPLQSSPLMPLALKL